MVADILVRPVSEPGWGKSTWVETIELNLGGNGANTSFTLARLGTRVRLWSAVGRDEFGEDVLAKLRGAGVDVSGVERSGTAPTPTSVVLVHPNGKRALLHRPGASQEAFADGIPLTAEVAREYSHLHLANIFSLRRFQSHAAALLEQAAAAGLTTSMDTAWDPQGLWMETLGPCLPHTGLLFVNEDEARQLTGSGDPHEAVRILREHGARDVVVKLGPQGCLAAAGDKWLTVPARSVDAVDTTGAGDCFAGGYLAALQRGLGHEEAARLANAVGAMCVRCLGAVTGIGSFEETERFANE